MQKTVEIKTGVENLYAFAFTRGEKEYASLCYVGDAVNVELALSSSLFEYLTDVCGDADKVDKCGGGSVISVSHRKYIKTNLTIEELAEILKKAKTV